MVKVIDKQDRNKLGEGRSNQMGFAFCKRVKTGQYETVQPISPCKDYLNDVVYSEHTGKKCVAYGLSYDKVGIFDHANYTYIAIKIMPYKYANDYNTKTLPKDVENLKNNYKNLQFFMREIDAKLGIKFKTVISQGDNDTFLVKMPKFWSKYTYLTSLYSLLLRVGQFYKEGDPMEYLKNFNVFLPDVSLVKNAYPKLERIIAGELPEQKLDSMPGNTTVHNCGIVGFAFPVKK